MLGSIHTGMVPTYAGGQEEIVYLVTDIDRVVESGSDFVFTDRNAKLDLAQFENDLSQVGTLVDWPLMEAKMWNNTPRGTRPHGTANGRIPRAPTCQVGSDHGGGSD